MKIIIFLFPLISCLSFRLSRVINDQFQQQEIYDANSLPLEILTTNRRNILTFQNDVNSFDQHQNAQIPDVTDKQTVLSFATMTSNSYYEDNDKKWTDIPHWNVTSKFGWENTGIRGYLYEDDMSENLIIVIKGTSLATPIGSGPTAINDKLNDNMVLTS
jgi:putative lipase involved disintegration of autophagic bodies